MGKIYVPAKKILTGQFPIKDLNKLNEYYQKVILNKEIMPVTLISINLYPIEKFKEELMQNKLNLSQDNLENELFNSNRLEKNIISWKNHGAKYILSDGNHRSVAYFSNNNDIPSREIKIFQDLKDINKEFRSKGQKGPAMMRNNKSLKQYLFKLYRSLSSKDPIHTIGGEIQNLINLEELKIQGNKLVYEPQLPF